MAALVMKLYLLGSKVVIAMGKITGWDGSTGDETLFVG